MDVEQANEKRTPKTECVQKNKCRISIWLFSFYLLPAIAFLLLFIFLGNKFSLGVSIYFFVGSVGVVVYDMLYDYRRSEQQRKSAPEDGSADGSKPENK